MTTCCARGSQAQLSIGGVNMTFVSFDGSHVMKVLSDGSVRTIRGTLDHNVEDVQDGILFANFNLSMYITPDKLTTLLPLMGLSTSGVTPPTTHQASDTIPEFTTILTTEGGLDFTFVDGKVGKWSVSGQKGSQPIMLNLSVSAKNLTTAAAGTYTHTSLVGGKPYAFSQGTFTFDGDAYLYDRFALSVDHGLIVEHNNSQTPTNICATDRAITLGTSTPFSSCQGTTDFVDLPLAGLNSAVGVLDFVNGTNEDKWTLAKLVQILSAPSVTKESLTRLPLHFRVYADGVTPSIQVKNTVGA